MSLTIAHILDHLQHDLNSDDGISFRVGPFSVNLRSSEYKLASGISKLYADYPLIKKPAFVDFRIQLKRTGLIRRYFRPQVEFFQDDLRPFKPLPSAEAFPFFEWGLNWCIATHAHHFLMLHAAVLEKEGRALVLPAAPGSGKSTLCAALTFSGWRLLSDEFALIDWNASKITPLPRPISLKNDSINIIQERFPYCEQGSLVEGTSKGTIAHLKPPLSAMLESENRPTPCWIVFPQYQTDSDTILKPLDKASAFIKTIDNSFNYNQLGKQGFTSVRALIERCASFDFRYSDLDEALEVFDGLVHDGQH